MTDNPLEAQTHESFECANCGAPRMEYDPASGMLKCPQCGSTRAIQASVTEVQEYELSASLTDAEKAHGYGRTMKAVECQSCGATTQYDPNVTSVTCPFCGSSQVLEQQPDPELIRPESVVPFKVDRDAAQKLYRQWLGRGFFRPRDLTRRAGAVNMQGIYLPFWTFDAHAESRWRAESGDYYYEDERYWATENGRKVQKTRRVRKVRWHPTSGRHSGDYDDILVKGSSSLDGGIFQKVANFDTKQLIPYQPDYLSGWAAESYRVALASAWNEGQQRIRELEHSACRGEVPGDTQRNLQVNTALSRSTFKHVLLPVWLSSYRYNRKVYNFLINGQTGQVGGQAPVDWIKVAIVIIFALLILGAVLFAASLAEGAAPGSLLPALHVVMAWHARPPPI